MSKIICNNSKLCDIWGSHSEAYESYCFSAFFKADDTVSHSKRQRSPVQE